VSSDNYYLIRKHPDGGYLVTCEFVSEESPLTTAEVLAWHTGHERYATLAEAQEYAYGEYSEYGVSYDFPVEIVER